METTETSNQLFRIVEEQLPFEPIKSVNGQAGKYMSFEYLSDDMDGVFTLPLHWINFANRIEKNGIPAYLNWVSKTLKFDNGYCTIERKSKWDNEATLHFKQPITVVFGRVGTQDITHVVSKIKGEFTYEWSWSKRGRQDKIANNIEIYFDCQEFE